MDTEVSQHRKLTLENNILPPLLPGLVHGTFQSQVRHSNHCHGAIPTPQEPDLCQKGDEKHNYHQDNQSATITQ